MILCYDSLQSMNCGSAKFLVIVRISFCVLRLYLEQISEMPDYILIFVYPNTFHQQYMPRHK
jgi:hypothetical protein